MAIKIFFKNPYTLVAYTLCMLSLYSCTLNQALEQSPIHFAQDLQSASYSIEPGQNIVLNLRLPSVITPTTQVVMYGAKKKEGPYEILTAKPVKVSDDAVQFNIPTLKTEDGYHFYQATIMMDSQGYVPYVRSDIEKIFINKPKNAYLQSILFGAEEYEQIGPIYMCAGSNRQLHIYGKYSDGIVRELTKSELGTAYQIANPAYYEKQNITLAVGDVTEDGLIETFNSGQATIIVTNDTVSNSREVMVDNCAVTR